MEREMWRPEGWENPFTVGGGKLSPEAEVEVNIYESGADAMLEALRKGGVYGECRDMMLDCCCDRLGEVNIGKLATEFGLTSGLLNIKGDCGYIVFIPE